MVLKMFSVVIILLFIFDRNYLIECTETEDKFSEFMEKYMKCDHSEHLIREKVCDTSTLDGQIDFTEEEAQKMLECEKLDDDQVNTYYLTF